MKRYGYIVSILALSSAVYASSTLPAPDYFSTLVNVPLFTGGPYIGLTGYYFHPTVSEQFYDYAYLSTINNAAAEIKNLEFNHESAWGLDLGLIFPQTGSDIEANYFQINTDKNELLTNITASANFPVTFTAVAAAAITANPIGRAATRGELDLNQIDLDFGQYINFGNHFQLHPQVGLRYAQVQTTLKSTYLGEASGPGVAGLLNPFSFTFLEATRIVSDFHGVGPLINFNANFIIGDGFSLVGEGSSALLIGNGNSELAANVITSQFTTGGIIAFTFPAFTYSNTFKDNKIIRISPTLNGKLGAKYSFYFNNSSSLSLEAGYHVEEIFNVINLLRSSLLVNYPTNGEVTFTANTPVRTTENLEVQGPYVSLMLNF